MNISTNYGLLFIRVVGNCKYAGWLIYAVLAPQQLNETDRDVVQFMIDAGGRVTPSWIAEGIGASTVYLIFNLIASGTATGDGTASRSAFQRVAAAGDGDGIGSASRTVFLTEFVASGTGTAEASADISVFVNFPDARGEGTATGTAAKPDLLLARVAAGTGDGIGAADATEKAPLTRADSFGLDFAEDESIGLNAERY